MTRRMRRWMLVSIALAACVTGCAVGPDYARPPVTPPTEFRSQVTPAETMSLADLPWWEAFNDPVLKGLIQETLANNYNLRVATARVQQAREQVTVARAPFYPALGYGVKAQRSKNFAAQLGIAGLDNNATNLFAGVLTASWELDVWGQIRRSSEAALAQLLATEEGRRGVILSLVSETAQAYFELLELDALLVIAKSSTAAYEGIYKVFKDRLEFGVTSELQTSRAEGDLASAAATIPELKSQIAAKENQISALLGRNPGPISRGTPLFEQPVVPSVPAGLPSALLERRPDLLQAEQQLVAANAEIGVAKAEFFPKLSLTGLLGKASPELSAITSGGATIWSITAGLVGPIFQGGKILANYRATQAYWAQVKWQYEQAVITAFQEVSSNLAALDDLSGAEVEQARAVRSLEKAVGHANDRFFYGLSSYFEVLEAMQRLYPAQNAQAQTRAKRLIAYVQLYKALGGGWNVADPQAMPPGQGRPGPAACAAAHC